MSKSKRELSAEEAALWARVARTAVPMPGVQAPVLVPAPGSVRHRTKAATSGPKAPPTEIRRGALADRGDEKRVRRGKLEIDAKLDLHGYTQDQARAALGAFLARAQGEGARVVIVVTGKGRLRDGEAAPGVLKRRLPEWLAAGEVRSIVAGYAEAHARHGGAGAFYVFLRRAA
ncbi:MAG: Smr/MutS family protein [Hyphomonadaceae bacterium]|nr:Smr/MutS family protein [Hyphomonadaceae bacterium]